MHPTTAKQFILFQNECIKWIHFYGLTHWKVDFKHEMPSVEFAIAECGASLLDKYAVLTLTLISEEKLTDVDIKEAAWHETTELFTMPLYLLASERHTTADQLTEARHSMIQSMKNFTFDPYIKKSRRKTK